MYRVMVRIEKVMNMRVERMRKQAPRARKTAWDEVHGRLKKSELTIPVPLHS